MRSNCLVLGCENTNGGGISFFKVPLDPIYRDVYRRFSRRGSHYVIKPDARICSDHFHASLKVQKKRSVSLKKKSVPTIYKQGSETIIVNFDDSVMHYLEEDTLLNPAYDNDKHELELREKRDKRLKEIKSLCSFCLYKDENEPKLIKVNTLKDYLIEPLEVFGLIGLKESSEFKRSDLICEECLESVVTFDGFRKRCCKAQTEVLKELKNFELELGELNDPPLHDDFDADSDDNMSTDFKKSFEDLPTEIDDKEDSVFRSNGIKIEIKTETLFVEEFSPLVFPKQEIIEPSVVIKETVSHEPVEEPKEDPGDDDYEMNYSSEDETDQEEVNNSSKGEAESKGMNQMYLFDLDVYNPADTSAVIKSKDKKFTPRKIYECFLCRLVSYTAPLISTNLLLSYSEIRWQTNVEKTQLRSGRT